MFFQGQQRDYTRNTLKIIVKPCNNETTNGKCYSEEVLRTRLPDIKVGGAWSSQRFQPQEYDTSKVIKNTFEYIFSEYSLFNKPAWRLSVKENLATLYDNEIYNFLFPKTDNKYYIQIDET